MFRITPTVLSSGWWWSDRRRSPPARDTSRECRPLPPLRPAVFIAACARPLGADDSALHVNPPHAGRQESLVASYVVVGVVG